MKMYLLTDPLITVGLFGFLFALVGILVESFILFLFRLNRYPKCLLDAVMANIGSFLLTVLLVLIFNKQEFEGVSQITELVILYFITVFFEAWIIKLLNKGIGWGRILVVSFAMNIISFIALYFYTTMYFTF